MKICRQIRRLHVGLCLAVLVLSQAVACAHDPVLYPTSATALGVPARTNRAQPGDDALAQELRAAMASGDQFRKLELCAQLQRRKEAQGELPPGLGSLLARCQEGSGPRDTGNRSSTRETRLAWNFDGRAQESHGHKPGPHRDNSSRAHVQVSDSNYCQARLPDSQNVTLRRPQRSYGSESTIELINYIARRHAARSGGRPLSVGDICRQGGGPLSGHRSHQTGYDADIGLPFKANAGSESRFATASRDNLDFAALWQILVDLSHDRRLKRVYLDYEVQSWLYMWALEEGAPGAQLDQLLQYPYGEKAAHGLVRHWPKHRDHLHLRLAGPQRIMASI